MASARGFFEGLSLGSIGLATSHADFSAALDRLTAELVCTLPTGAQHWGLGRKLLNIFLRDSLYTSYLRDAYSLGSIEPLLELPLDSVTGAALQEVADGTLPRWAGVKNLQPTVSAQYQAAAQAHAQRIGVARVHLDAYWWAAQRSAVSD